MSDDLKTVGEETTFSDPLRSKQIEGVQRMRTSLLSCDDNPLSVRHALNNITILRIYHQLTRVIRYTEMMDKIEERLYQSMDAALDQINPDNNSAWVMLMNMQSQLQENMLSSHKLIQPYLDMLKSADMFDSTATEIEESAPKILDQVSRERLRGAAQEVLASLQLPERVEVND